MPMGAADVAFVVWSRFLRHDPTAPDWPDRDRFVLSAGHGSALLYGLLHLSGYELPLSHRQVGPALADIGLQAILQVLYPVTAADALRGLAHLLLGGLGDAVADVVQQGA